MIFYKNSGLIELEHEDKKFLLQGQSSFDCNKKVLTG